MFVEMKSILSDAVRSKEIDVSLEQVRAWLTGDLAGWCLDTGRYA